MNPFTRQTLGWLLDEVDATRGSMAEGHAIQLLIGDRLDRDLFSAAEAAEVTSLLTTVWTTREHRLATDSLADTFSLTDQMRIAAELI